MNTPFDSFPKLKSTHTVRGFTLVELLILIALIATLSVVVLLILNPAEQFKAARDSRRLSDLNTVNRALSIVEAVTQHPSPGSSSIVYVSLPDSDSLCGSYVLPSLQIGWMYHCSPSSTYHAADGSGWIPGNFSATANQALATLPVDPVNMATGSLYYTYVRGGSWELSATMESNKYKNLTTSDNGDDSTVFEAGTDLSLTPLRVTSSIATRNWRYWPFSQTSPWNYPIGSGATYATVPGLSLLPTTFNTGGRWTASIIIATTTDPLTTLYYTPGSGPSSTFAFLAGGGANCGNSGGTETTIMTWTSTGLPADGNYYSTLSTPDDTQWILPTSYHKSYEDYVHQMKMPSSACPSPDSDGLMTVIQPDGWAVDTYATIVLSGNRVVATMGSYIDTRGSGIGWWNGRRASMFPSFAGIIRTGEIANGLIPHALIAQMPPSILTEQAIWPAYTFDRTSGYTGTLPMGALLAIPSSTDINTLGLTTQGKVVAKAAQDYGVYAGDRGGSGIAILMEYGNPDIWPNSYLDLQKIRDVLRWVTNNDSTNRGGGGTPLASFPPPFYDGSTASI